jgi:hypothetical protein
VQKRGFPAAKLEAARHVRHISRMKVISALIVLVAISTVAAAAPNLDGWFVRLWHDAPQPPPDPKDSSWSFWEKREPLQPTTTAAGEGRVLTLPVSLPGKNQFVRRATEPWWGYDQIEIELSLQNLPATAEVYLFVKDWDILWYQSRLEWQHNSTTTQTFVVPISGQAAVDTWQVNGHGRPWHQLTRGQIAEFGVQIDNGTNQNELFAGEVQIADVRLEKAPRNDDARLEDMRISPEQAVVGEMVEAMFTVNLPFQKPFDGKDVDLYAEIISVDPERIISKIRAFYYEAFLANPGDDRGALTAWGKPQFRVRYTPPKIGEYEMRISGSVGGKKVALPPLRFSVGEPEKPWRGYVRVSEVDRRRLEFSTDGSVFNGIGLNVRSPFDTRYVASFPSSDWEYEDLNMYERLLPKYAAAGINVVEIWMSSWWLALEWIPNARGSHGVGHMNQFRAWKLDRLFEIAQQHDIYLVLVVNNHGKFSEWVDQEWAFNPFNKANGGFLTTPREYFQRDAAKDAARRFVDYVTARWGYAANLMAWKLFSEIDLTGDAKDKGRSWYRDPSVTEWHKEIGDYFKKVDPNKHLVTTHWAGDHKMVNKPLARIKQLDMLTVDAYYSKNEGAKRLFDLVTETIAFAKGMDKPVAITEFGGNPWGDSTAHIINQQHLGIWRGYFGNMAVAPLFWWFPMVEEQNLYDDYRALANFIDGDDTRKAICDVVFFRDNDQAGEAVTAENADGLIPEIALCTMTKERACWCWLVDRAFYNAGDLSMTPVKREGITVDIRDMKPGKYAVEYWNCKSGVVTSRGEIEIAAGQSTCRVAVPPFTRDVAIKLKVKP